jgi:hypothetical protein
VQLSSRTTVCIIGNVNLYETGDYSDDLAMVMFSLTSVIYDESPIVKLPLTLLFTSPRTTVEARKLFKVYLGSLLHMKGLLWVRGNYGVCGLHAQFRTQT